MSIFSHKKLIPRCAHKIEPLVEYLRKKYGAIEYQIQVFDIDDEGKHGKLLQLKREESKVKKATGLTKSASIKLITTGDNLEYEIFGGNWIDKAAGQVIGWAILWPLLVTSGVGIWKQNELLNYCLTMACR